MTNDFDRYCGNLASVLTAYFDGQATPAEARVAHAHLRECERCAELWLAWEQTRALLKDDVIVAPPGLAQRILMVCRMEGFRRGGIFRGAVEEQRALPPEIVAMTLGLQSFDNFRKDEAREILPPPHLRDTILNLTTRAETVSPGAERPEDPVFADVTFDAPLRREDAAGVHDTMLVQGAGAGDRGGYSARGVIRRAFAFAAPAMLLLMMWPGGGNNFGPETTSVAVAPLAQSAGTVSVRSLSNLAHESKHALNVGLRAMAYKPAAVPHAVSDANDEVPVERTAPTAAVEARWNRDSAAEAARTPEVTESRAAGRASAAHARGAEAAGRAAERAEMADETHPVPQLRPTTRIAAAPEAPRRLSDEIMDSLQHARRSTPRLLTTVSFTPVSLRSAVVRPALARKTNPAVDNHSSTGGDADNDSGSDSSLDGSLDVAPVMDSYRAALAEDMDGSVQG